MLKMFMELKGKIPNKIVRKGSLKDQHFDEACSFLCRDIDKVTQREKVIVMPVVHVSRSIIKEINMGEKTPKVGQLADLLDKIFVIDPSKRLHVNQCLTHPFITER